MDRRTFVRVSAAGAAAWWASGCSDQPFAPGGSPGALVGRRPPKRVVVIGAGMAGLVAGYELRRAGHDVTVLEARDRVGGRVLTLRAPFAAGHSAEAGAARIPPHHHLTLGYADHFGLVQAPFYPPDGSFVELAAGRRTLQPSASFRAARPDYVKIVGGTDRLPGAFARALRNDLLLGTPAARVSVDRAGALVRVEDGAELVADRVLVTVPLPVLERIDFVPGLSTLKRAAAAGDFAYQSATRVYLRFSERFWEAEGLNGWGITDWPEEVWHPTWDVPGPGGVLLTYVRGARARSLDALDADERVRSVLERWTPLFPNASGFLGGVSHSWQDEEWSRAAWASPDPVADAELTDEVRRPEGPIHFAGEHLSSARGWMQGALESGLRAAQEIHAAELRSPVPVGLTSTHGLPTLAE